MASEDMDGILHSLNIRPVVLVLVIAFNLPQNPKGLTAIYEPGSTTSFLHVPTTLFKKKWVPCVVNCEVKIVLDNPRSQSQLVLEMGDSDNDAPGGTDRVSQSSQKLESHS